MFLGNAVKAGVSVTDFWDMTPKETDIVINACLDRLEQDRTNLRIHAWLTAALSRTKKMPELDEFVNPPPPKTPEELEEDKRFFEQMRERYSGKRGGKA